MKIKNSLLIVIALLPLSTTLVAFYRKPVEKDIYEIKVYRMKTNDQVTQVDNFLKNAYLPALHRLGVSSI
ncbi:MAG: family containing protein, partial [Segetibacter sp.]|nr:family containing protein [Segetibacter sp.]